MSGHIVKRNNVKIIGAGTQTMVFAHGFGCDQHMWRFVAPAFADEYRVVLFDYVGSGMSDKNSYDAVKYGDLHGYAQDVLDICEALDLKDAVFVGHSVGGMIGLLASIRNPVYFSRMVLIAPSPRYINDFPDYIGGFERKDLEELLAFMEVNVTAWAAYLAPVVMGNADRPALTGELESSFCAIDPVVARRFAEATFLADNRKDLDKVSIPSLILQCAQDLIAPLEVGAYMHHHLPQSTLQLMQATGHCPHMSHPEETINLIKAYLVQ